MSILVFIEGYISFRESDGNYGSSFQKKMAICLHTQNLVYREFCFQPKWDNRDQIYPTD